ncbi:MAG: NADH-quinone oxidoreductase subunit N, partial [Planctomycetota bacterium]
GKLLALVAAVTMTLGNLAALQQTSLKRMLAYSSVAHVGYILMGVAAADFGGGGAGWHAVTFYTVAYLAMNLGAFGCVVLAQNKLGSDEISKFAGLGLRAPLISVCLAVCVISLLGLPPTAGFSGKVQLFMSAIAGGMTWLAIVAAINTAISAYYYARVIKVLYFDKSEDATPLRMPLLGEMLVFGHMLAVLYLGVRFGDLLATIQTLTIN